MKTNFDLNIKPFGQEAILIEWPNEIDDAILDDIILFTSIILKHEIDKLINHTPGYNSLVLQYDSAIDFNTKNRLILDLYKSRKEVNASIPNHWHIPVCYDEEFGLDLKLFADIGLNPMEVIRLHTSQSFRVYMIGFLPGFLYLGGLLPELHMNRKVTPRLKIVKGSIAIGGAQTGIYPMDSPGGWQIIGRTPLTLFDLNKKHPTPIKQGDYVQFYAVTKELFLQLSSEKSEKLLPQKHEKPNA